MAVGGRLIINFITQKKKKERKKEIKQERTKRVPRSFSLHSLGVVSTGPAAISPVIYDPLQLVNRPRSRRRWTRRWSRRRSRRC